MVAKASAAPPNGAQGHQPQSQSQPLSSSLGTTAVSASAPYRDYALAQRPSHAASWDPSASSSLPQHSPRPQQHQQHDLYAQTSSFSSYSPHHLHQLPSALPEQTQQHNHDHDNEHIDCDHNHSQGNTHPESNGFFPDPSHPTSPSHNAAAHWDNGTTTNHHDHQLDLPVASVPHQQQRLPPPKGRFTEEWDASQRGSSIIHGPNSQHIANNMSSIQRSNSFSGSTRSGAGGAGGDGSFMDGSHSIQVSRSNTLKKKSSLRRGGSLKKSNSRRSMKAGSVRSLALQSTNDEDEMHSAFYCPVPTTGNPTEALADRFQAWRKVLKDIITYFKEVQTFYEQRSKALLKLANVLNNVHMPPGFLPSGGLDDAVQVLRNYNSQAILEANKAREIEEDVILALTGLRSDLQLKIKEIKTLSGDFKNSVEKEMDVTKKAVRILQETLGKSDLDSALTTGKEDPYLLRLAVDRQLERQLDEENYLHQAYLNLENSGRELESIVVGEIQKSYNALAGIMKREAEAAMYAIDELRVGPIAMPKDHEWANFVRKDDQFVDPAIPIRSSQYIHYPGKDHFACQEIRAGLLERKTKYLKSYTAGWYVLSPTHLHEFKSADKTQSPVMSLYLPDQKLGSHSQETGSSPKFILKGRQTGGVHRGHSWVFRAESHDTMMAWYEDIKALTEKTPQERNDFVRGHSRSFSRTSSHRSVSSDGVVDEDDDEPYSAHTSSAAPGSNTGPAYQQDVPRRPSPGGRFPSDIEVNAQRGLQVPLSPSSLKANSYKDGNQNSYAGSDSDAIAAAGALPGSAFEQYYSSATVGQDPQQGYAQTQQPQAIYPRNQPTQPEPPMASYVNHPATIIAARAAQNNAESGEYSSQPTADDYQNANGIQGNSTEAVGSIAVAEGVKPTQSAQDPYATKQRDFEPITGVGNVDSASTGQAAASYFSQAPRTAPVTVSYANGGASSLPIRPTVGDRGQSEATTMSTEAPTLSSEAATISHLHIPGEYPKATPLRF
ncbi:hypothetical protein BD289DRAFT_487268 [Coniella lustricola]|uniref:PH domain-containing protein n=1 Tax=Coniella lustricola TaxID=2025994 RepID=A0A2T2ZSE8_9PEZI|nr:hypothetical protein BD289DRAFT_487268 [Coniella lustricola]